MEKRLLWKFNLIDLILIALVLFSLAALLYKVAVGSGEGDRSYEFSYVCDEAPSEFLYGVAEGDKCADADNGTELGTVKWINVEELQATPGKARAVIGAEIKGTRLEHGVNVGDALYLKGQKVQLIVDDSVFEAYISDIKTGN